MNSEELKNFSDILINHTLSSFAAWWNELDPEDTNDYGDTVYISEDTIKRFKRFLEQQNKES